MNLRWEGERSTKSHEAVLLVTIGVISWTAHFALRLSILFAPLRETILAAQYFTQRRKVVSEAEKN